MHPGKLFLSLLHNNHSYWSNYNCHTTSNQSARNTHYSQGWIHITLYIDGLYSILHFHNVCILFRYMESLFVYNMVQHMEYYAYILYQCIRTLFQFLYDDNDSHCILCFLAHTAFRCKAVLGNNTHNDRHNHLPNDYLAVHIRH